MNSRSNEYVKRSIKSHKWQEQKKCQGLESHYLRLVGDGKFNVWACHIQRTRYMHQQHSNTTWNICLMSLLNESKKLFFLHEYLKLHFTPFPFWQRNIYHWDDSKFNFINLSDVLFSHEFVWSIVPMVYLVTLSKELCKTISYTHKH